MKRYRSLALFAMFAVAAVMGGCSAPKEPSPSAQNDVAANPERTGGAGTSGTPHFEITAVLNPATEDINNNEFIKKMAADANVDITFTTEQSDWATKKAALLASGSLPDAILGSGCVSNSEVTSNVGLFAPLSKLIKDNAPRIQATIDNDKTYRNVITDMNGEIYFLALREMFRPETYTSLQINKTWLDAVGKPMPTTIDELMDVLRAFRDGDPNGNGDANDEYPMYIQLDGDEAWSVRCFMGAFDCAGSISSLFALNGDKVIYQPVTENYKKFATWIAQLRAENLMPEEIATADWSTFSARLGSDTPIVGVVDCWVKDPLNPTYQDQYETVAPLAGPEGHRFIAGNSLAAQYDGTPRLVISAACGNKEALIKYFDEYYEPINSAQIYYGPIGTTLSQDAQGKLTMNEPPEGMSWDTWKYKYSGNGSWPIGGGEAVESLFAEPPAIDQVKLSIDAVNKPYVKPNAALPTLKFTQEESDELAIIQTDVEGFVKQQLAEWFVNGQVEQTWDAYLSELKNMNVDRYIEIYQAAYDRQK